MKNLDTESASMDSMHIEMPIIDFSIYTASIATTEPILAPQKQAGNLEQHHQILSALQDELGNPRHLRPN